MAKQLSSDESVNLTKTDPSLTNIIVGLGWDKRETDEETYDLDLSILMVKADGKARSDSDFIYYNQKNSVCSSVHYVGDDKSGTGDGDDESIHVFLNKVPAEIEKLIVCGSIFHAYQKNQHFGQVLNAFIYLVNKDNQEEVARYDLSKDASTHSSMIFGEIYRYDGEWKFKAVGQGFMGGLAELIRLHGLNG